MKKIARNKKAEFNYKIEKRIEAGIVLKGSEVKSLREGRIGFADSFAKVKDGEMWLYNLNIPMYKQSSHFSHDPKRKRKLLLKSHQIKRLGRKTAESGYTLVPLKMYFNDNGYVKVELGLASGRKKPDKKQYLIQKQKDREMDRAMKKFQQGKY